jgi:hypothetical protein
MRLKITNYLHNNAKVGREDIYVWKKLGIRIYTELVMTIELV